MAKPITWRNIAAPNFSSAPIGQAIDAFRSAAGGFSDLTSSLFKTQDRVDASYTNEALKQALQTGRVDPSLNPRADAATVWDAVLGKRRADTDDQYTQEQTRNVGLEADQRAFEQTPEQRALQARINAQALAEGEVGIKANLASIDADKISARLAQRRLEIENRRDSDSIQTQDQYRQLENFLTRRRQEIYEQHLQANPTDTAGAELAAETWDRSGASRREVQQFRVANNISPEAYEISTWGERDALMDAKEVELAGEATKRAQLRAEAGLDQEISETYGYLGNTVIDRNGKRAPYTKDMAARERMGSYDEAIAKLRLQGINVNNLDGKTGKDIEHQVIEAARYVLPNASLLAPAIEPYIRKGKFDAEGFRDNVLNKVGPLTIQDRINRSRIDAGLSPIDWSESEGGAGASAADILGAAPPAVKSAFGGIAMNLIPSSLRPDAEQFLSENSQARLNVATELAKTSVRSPIDKANLFVTLLKAYLNKTDQSQVDSSDTIERSSQ